MHTIIPEYASCHKISDAIHILKGLRTTLQDLDKHIQPIYLNIGEHRCFAFT